MKPAAVTKPRPYAYFLIIITILLGLIFFLGRTSFPVQAKNRGQSGSAIFLLGSGTGKSISSLAPPSGRESSKIFSPIFSPDPVVTLSTGTVLMGENFVITATFENNGGGAGYGPTGYGPFIDLYIPHKGPDGVYPNQATYDGISPETGVNYSASLDGEILNVVTQTFPDDGAGTGCVDHPWGLDTNGIFLVVCGTAGDQLVSIELPYGSYTPAQPTLSVTVPVRLSEYANLGSALIIRGRGGFVYGATPAVDWCCTVPVDTTLVSDSGAPSTWAPFSDVNPSVFTFSKSTDSGELATGPNSPGTFSITVDLAPGQNFSNIDITDNLPNNLVYLGGLTTTPAADSVSEPVIDFNPHNGDTIILHWDGPIDSDSVSSIAVSFGYYIPEVDANGIPIAPGTTENQASLDQMIWSPADGSANQDLSGSAGIGTASTSDLPLILSKSSSISIDTGQAGFTPGDVIQYTLNFEISDYFGFDNLSLQDKLPDGQHYYSDGSHFPSLSITRNGTANIYPFSSGNVLVDCNYTGAPGPECDLAGSAGNPGETTITFDIDQELSDQLVNSQVLGDLVADGGPTADVTTAGTVQFFAVTLDKYTDIYSSPDNYVKMGDSQTNSAFITGDQVDPSSCNPGPCIITSAVSANTASSGITIGRGTLDKAIIAVNNAYCNLAAPGDPCLDVSIAAGDTVTYRILYDLETGDYANLSFTDFLPLPIFYAEDPNNDGSSLVTWPQDVINPIPAPGTWDLGLNDTRGHLPDSVSLSPQTVDNNVVFNFGDFDDPVNDLKTIEIIFTVRVTDQVFGDGLRMRNSVLQQDANSPGVTSSSNNNVDLTLTEPVLLGDKSVVSTDHTGIEPNPPIAAPIVFVAPGNSAISPWNTGSAITSDFLGANGLSSGIDGIDGGDLVKFALVIENVGSGINGAFDITLRDSLPAGYLLPGMGLGGFNLQIYRGDGKALDDGTGSGLEFLGPNGDATDFFGDGIRLRDPADDNPAFIPTDPEYGQGLCQAHEASSGKNIIILTYDLLVDPNVSPGTVLRNKGEIIEYSGEEGGENYLPGPDENPSDSVIGTPALDKQRTGTEFIEVFNDDDQAVIGEQVYYELVVTIPEGVSPATLIVDTLDNGLAFASQDSFAISNPDTGLGDLDGGISYTGSEVPAITNNGRSITWDLGTVSNTNDDNSAAETLTFTYTVQVYNVAGNQTGTGLNNSVTMAWDALDADENTVTASEGPESSVDVIVVEPQINVVKEVVVGGSGSSGDAGDSVVYTITFTADAASPTAYETDLSDILSTDIDFTSSGFGITSVTDTAGVLLITSFEIAAGNELRLLNDLPIDMEPGRQVVITLTGELRASVYTGQDINNDAIITWTSMDGDHNPGAEDGERTGEDGAGGLNDYESTGNVVIDIINPSPSKTVVTTSEAHTGIIGGVPRMVIGEIVRYRLEIRLAEGTTNDLVLRDRLRAGLIFLNDGTAKVIFVSSSGLDIDSQDSAAPDVVPGIDDPTAFTDDSIPLASIVPVYALPDANIANSLTGTADVYNSGTDVYFKLGDVFNSELDDNAEYAVIEFNALIANNASTYSGRSRYNSFSIYVDEDGDGNAETGELIDTSNSVRVIIAEPVQTLVKSLVTSPSDAGDAVVYRLVLSNSETGNNDATAFDLVLTDSFDIYLTSLSVDSVVYTQDADCLGNGAGTSAFSHDGGSFSGRDFTFTASCLDQGQTITIEISAVLANDAPANYVLQNAADLTWSSLPGEKGTASNPTGSDVDDASTSEDDSGGSRGERNGSESPVENDYIVRDNVDVTLDVPTPVKSIVSTTAGHTSEAGDGSAGSPRDLAVGEIIRYRLTVELVEGTNTDLSLVDTLPAGFSYAGDSTVRVSFLASVDITESADLAGADNDALPPTFTLPASRISVVGQDVTFTLGTLVNNDINDGNAEYAVIDFDVLLNNDDNNNNTDLDNNDFDVLLEAVIVAASNAVQTRIVEPVLDIQKLASSTEPSYGEIFNYSLAVSHLGGSLSEAFDIVIMDTIPAGLTYVGGSAGPANWSPSFDGTDTLTWTCSSSPLPSCSLPLLGSETLVYSVVMDPAPSPPDPGDTFNNTASITWTSLDGSDVNERTGNDNGGTEPYNDYRDSSSELVTLTNPELQVSKDDGVAFYVPGLNVVYDIVVENVGNSDVTGAVVSDDIPPQVGTWTWVCAGSTGTTSGCDGVVGSGANFNDTVNLGANSSITYQVTANIPSSSTGDMTNTVTVAMPAGIIEPTPGNNTASDTDVQQSHADLRISKDDGVTIVSSGQILTYTVLVENISPSDVFGAEVTDSRPVNILSWTWACTGSSGSASGCTPAASSAADFSDFIDLPAGSSITYTVTAQVSPAASGTVTNIAIVAVPAGVTEDDLSNNSDDDIDGIAEHTKLLDSQVHGVTVLPEVAIGEIVTYEITLEVPQGSMPNLTLLDILDRGLAFVDCVSITGPGLTVVGPADLAAVCANPTISTYPGGSLDTEDLGRQIEFDFGTLNNNSAGIVDLVLLYQVVVLDSLENQSDSTPPLNNQAVWTWDSGTLSDQAVGVVIFEPDLYITKEVDLRTIYPGQLRTFTITVGHTGASQTSAFNVEITDIIPVGLDYQPIIRHISGPAPSDIDDSSAPTLYIRWDEFPNTGIPAVLEIDVMLESSITRLDSDQRFTNDASVSWTSLLGDFSTPQSTHNPLSTERFYDPVSDINIYGTSDRSTVRVPALPDTGFAPGKITALPIQSEYLKYGDLDGLRVEIPDLGISLPIVSVPQSDQGWDLTWLWNQAGWLEGTAYPSWYGNTVITGHAYLSNGLPGPFVDLDKLSWGDEIILYAHGLKYTYQVRIRNLVSAYDLSILDHKDQDWLTLFTCQEYNETTGQYNWRQVIQAVLIDVEEIQ